MKNSAVRLPQAVHRPYFPILLILIANILVGLLTFQDYGLSWDEPLFYQYGDAVPYAYSIKARLSGDFDIEKAYGPSAEDHKIYGPIYLLLAKPVVDALDWTLPLPRSDLWHLVNFLTFQAGVVIFYALCLRWMRPWAAFGAALLFCTQPVLWGHAWINPKDVPFTVFFLAAVYFGFRMVDALTEKSGNAIEQAAGEMRVNPHRLRSWRKAFQITALVFISLAFISMLFSSQLESMLSTLIRSAYQSSPDSFIGRLFGTLAANAGAIEVQAYINKGLILFARLRSLLVALCVVFTIPALLLTFWSRQVERVLEWLANRMVPLPSRPTWWWKKLSSPAVLVKTLLAGILLGLVVSIRVVGPLAGILVILYFFLKHEHRSFAGLVVYAGAALAAMYISWPYLWDAPVGRFIEVLGHMSHNPKVLPVLFRGTIYPSDNLPVAYLPVMLGVTLTWTVWPLFVGGLVAFGSSFKSRRIDWRSFTPILLWFLVPAVYVLLFRPPIYDGYRHFLFILPPVFITAGLAFQALKERLRITWHYALVLLVLVAPGVIGLVKMHPYEYTYYNLLVDGTGGAYRHYETDFWLTCYKELMAQVDEGIDPDVTLFVHRQPSIAREYASPGMLIERFDPDDDRTYPGSLLLVTTRANVDLSLHPEAQEILSVGRDGAVFCMVKEIP